MTQHGETDYLGILGKAASAVTVKNLPPEVLARARQRVLDTIGCLVAGYHGEVADIVRAYLDAEGGKPQATLLPGGSKTTASHAAFAHATYIHGLELADAAPRGTSHPGTEIVPAALAVAEKAGVGGAAILPAVVAGYEVQIRIGRALFPQAFYRGWWTQAIFGGIGAAAASGRVLGLDGAGLAHALGIVLNLLPTAVARTNDEGASVKWMLGGQASAAGVLASEMASRGISGLRDIAGGWLPVIADDYHPERLIEDTADGVFTQWELLRGILTKYYATVGPLTAPLDATFDLVARHDIKPEDIVEIEANCMKRTAVFNTRHPGNEVAARGSLPYCLAAAVYTRDPAQLLGPAFSREMLRNEAIRAIEDKVIITDNEDYERQYPEHSKARITFRLGDGHVYTQEEDRSARPRYLTPTDADIEGKFRLIAGPVLGESKTARVIALVSELERLPDISELMGELACK